MAYCEQADILDLIPRDDLVGLTFDGDPSDYETEEELAAAQDAAAASLSARAIADAGAEIDGYCAARYRVPFDPVPALITKFAAEIAVYLLFARRQGATEDRRTRYKDAIRFLTDVSNGKATLPGSPLAAAKGNHTPALESDTRIFTRDNLEGF